MNPLVGLLALTVATATPPVWLSHPEPGTLLRWPTVGLVDEHTGKATTAPLAPGRPLRFSLTGPALIRLRGAFRPGCEPAVIRRSARDDGWLDLPLAVRRDGADRVVVVSPAVSPGLGNEETEAPATYRLELGARCPPLPLRVHRAVVNPDEYGLVELALAVRRAAGASRPHAELLAWLRAQHPHRWQQAAALAAALPALLASVPGRDEAARLLAAAWTELALRDLRAEDLEFARLTMPSAPYPKLRPSDSPQPFYRLPGGTAWEVDVAGADALRLFARPLLEATVAVATMRVEVQFDDRPVTAWLGASSRDPAESGIARQRSLSLPVPPGARRARIRSRDVLWLRGMVVTHKVHLEDVIASREPAELLGRAAAVRGEDLRSRLAAAIARAQLGEPAPLRELLARTAVPGAAGALAAVVAAEESVDPTTAEALRRKAREQLDGSTAELFRAAAPLLAARLARAEAAAMLRADRPGEAVAALVALATKQPLTAEDALLVSDADGLAAESFEGGAPALTAIDGLTSIRPLDRRLLVARGREFALATGWHSLAPDPGVREAAFLEPPPPPVPPAGPPAATRGDRAVFVKLLPSGAALDVTVPAAPLLQRQSVLSVVVVRGAALARMVTVTVDGKPVALPALAPFERFDLPVAAGGHQVALGSPGFSGEVYVNYAAGAEWLRVRRYVELPPAGTEWHSSQLGAPSLALIAVRLAADAGATPSGEVELVVTGAGPAPTRLRLRPGTWRTERKGELAPGLVITDPVEVALPLPSARAVKLEARGPRGVRVLAHLALRRHRPAAPPPLDPASAVGGAGPDAETVLQEVARLTAQLTAGEPAAARAIARAGALLDLDEVGLAREDLLSAIDAGSLGAHQRAVVAALWRSLDEAGSTHPASVPRGEQPQSATLLLADGRADAIGVGLLAVLDAPAALRQAGAAELRRRAGASPAGDLAVLVAARLAGLTGEDARAAELWLDLARTHPGRALIRREAGTALLRLADPQSAALAYLELTAACELQPRDALAHRLLRRAAARTRLRALKHAERSGGARGVLLSGGEPLDPSVEAALLPEMPAAGDSTLLTASRQARLTFSLQAPVTLRLRARLQELRRHELAALGGEPLAIEWSRDGELMRKVACDARGACASEPIPLAAGDHVLEVRAVGGLRPAGRLWVDAERPPARGRAPPGPRTVAASYLADHLVAAADQPVFVVVHGPALLRVEARARADRRGARRALLSAEAPGAAPLTRTLDLAAAADPRAVLESGAPLSPAAVAVLPLPAPAAYRVQLRPAAGELLVRLAVRVGDEGLVDRPVTVAVYRPLAAAPALLPAALQAPPSVHVIDGDVAPGLDAVGAVTVGSRFAHEAYSAVGVPVQTSNVWATGCAYRRLLDAGWLTLKLNGDVRVRSAGSPAEWLGAEAFFMHPKLRQLRGQLTLDGYTQPVAGHWHFTGGLGAMVEPVFTLVSGLHSVSKIGFRWAHVGPEGVPDAQLPAIDPNVYSRYLATHRRALFFEQGFEAEPFANVVLYANARLTTNSSLNPGNQDHLSTTMIARAVFGRLYAEAAFRLSWFFVDVDRPDPRTYQTLYATLFHTFWTSARQRFEVGVNASYHFDRRVPDFALYLAWEGSNGRRFRDHTPLEGEDYFFPQRGPGVERGRIEVGR
jgi:hypothetical protein